MSGDIRKTLFVNKCPPSYFYSCAGNPLYLYAMDILCIWARRIHCCCSLVWRLQLSLTITGTLVPGPPAGWIQHETGIALEWYICVVVFDLLIMLMYYIIIYYQEHYIIFSHRSSAPLELLTNQLSFSLLGHTRVMSFVGVGGCTFCPSSCTLR